MESNLPDNNAQQFAQPIQQPGQLPNTPGLHKKIKILFGIIFILFVLFTVISLYFIATNSTGTQQDATLTVAGSVVNSTPTITPEPTPFPFEDMTIPYLRKQQFTSKLNELELLYNDPSYTAYLTSYTSDGLRIDGLLTKPAGEAPAGGFPAIVFIHGYIPPTQYETAGQAYSSYVDYLARNGFVVFKIDLRGHADSEGSPGGGYYSSDYIKDTLNAYAALHSTDFVNPEKIGLWGHSMAGNVSLRAIAARPEIPAIVIWAGAVYSYEDMQKYRIQDGSYQPPPNDSERQRKRRELFAAHGEFSPDSPFWKQVAPTNYLNDLKGAIQLHHAVDDPVVNVGYSRDLVALLDKTTVLHELHEYQSGGHNISGSSFNTAMQSTVEFFKKHL
jgi:dipeptidyl aminopeptidase/acylaminoacyl peptidase